MKSHISAIVPGSAKPLISGQCGIRRGHVWNAAGETTNGWKYTFAGGRAGHDLALRAVLAKYEVGAQLCDQVIYPNCAVDERGEALDGANKYVLHFGLGQLPPVATFWNLAMCFLWRTRSAAAVLAARRTD